MLLLPSLAAAQETQQVRVWLPEGISVSNIRTTDTNAGDGTKFVVLEDVRATNPSATDYQRYGYRDFHLIAFKRGHATTYYPVVRPGWKSVDFHWDAIAMPRETIVQTVSFEVPADVDEANFEFIPNWADSRGGFTDFMYYPGGKAF